MHSQKNPNPISENFITRAIHGGTAANSSVTPIYQGVNSPRGETGVAYVSELGANGGPTVEALESLMADLEGASWSLAFPAGQAAIGMTLFGLLQSGDRVVAHRNIYNYATKLLREDLPNKWGVEVEWVDMRDVAALRSALAKPTKLVYFEPIPNPAFHLLDSQTIITIAKEAGALVALDNTLMSPFLYRPLNAGADIVIQSATKYLCGHGDALGGIVSGSNKALGEQLARFRNLMGGLMAPMSAYLISRGIRTLPFRMERHCQNSQAIAEFLRELPQVIDVRYPGLDDFESSPEVKAQYQGFGGILGVQLQPDMDNVAIRHRVKMAHPWGSLGDVGTLVVAPGEDPSRDIPPNYLRIAVGLEAIEDIKADLHQAIIGP